MKRISIAKCAVAFAFAATLYGCYVLPMDPRLLPNQAVMSGQPGPSAVVVPPPQPVPQNLQARLYPLNEMAGKMGALTASVTDSVNGHATFTVPYAGEILHGEASRVANDYPGFGNIHRQVYGESRMPSGLRGIASAAGANGTYVNCEYALNGPGRGTGACLFSNGAKFQLHFGG
jgi:hypothetical protein